VNVTCKNCGCVLRLEDYSPGTIVPCPQCQHSILIDVAPQAGSLPEAADPVSPLPFAASVQEQESIFQSPEPASDALFGDVEVPRIEIPAKAAEPLPPIDVPSSESLFGALPQAMDTLFASAELPPVALGPKDTLSQCEDASPARGAAAAPEELERLERPQESALPWWAEATSSPLVAEAQAEPAPLSSDPGIAAADGALAVPAPEQLSFGVPLTDEAPQKLEAEETALVSEAFPTSLPRRPRYSSTRGGLFIALVVVPLFSYSVMATVAVLILYLRPPQPSLEYLPDVEGDFPGAKRQKGEPVSYQRLDPDSPVPPRLRIGLGQTIQLGDVRVIPQKVELRRVGLLNPDGRLEEAGDESLVLHLVLQNVSDDVVFSPSDPFFDRQWKSAQESKPYTLLEIGGQRFYGGPLPWRPDRRSETRTIVDGQAYRLLQPGEQLTTLVCTDPADHVGNLLAHFHGKLLYRVQVRRGLVRVGDREAPATAVVGIAFTDTQIERSSS
jgi:hypothetical protein